MKLKKDYSMNFNVVDIGSANYECIEVPWGLTAVQEAAFWRKRGSNNKTKSWLPPFYHTKYHYTIMPKYNFASCLIQKNMATVQVSTYCYLENPAEFHAQNKSIQSMWWGDSLCTSYRPRHFLNGTQFADLLSNGTKFFAVIRDPFDRFVSGYVDKCINEVGWLNEVQRCFGCLDDLRCFLDAVYRLLVDYQAGKINRMTNMAEYYITHFAPQTWYCDFEHHKNDYTFIIYHGGVNGSERTAAEFDQMYASSNVPKEQRDYIQSEMLRT
ncbi:hypothetical protein Q1695_007789 [Nippostrongylus brasiliensis]|nr:hypothetical protein Q1695_007789 [Nippostrongylus brasiliensis]